MHHILNGVGSFFGLWWFTVVFVTFALQFYTSK